MSSNAEVVSDNDKSSFKGLVAKGLIGMCLGENGKREIEDSE